MEFEELRQKPGYNSIPECTPVPWYTRYRRLLWLILAALIISLIAAIILVSSECITCRNTAASTQHWIDSAPLEWDGVCPRDISECPSSFQNNSRLLLVSLDGFRAEYLSRGITPTLSRLGQCSVNANFMYPVYPTKTFPNHYSIVTGLYPSSHGIIDNTIYDLDLQKLFKVGKTKLDDPSWWQKEPIWVTARKQGKETASYFWPGSDVRINGYYPNTYRPFNKSTPFETRVDQVLEWLNSSTPPDFTTLYLDQPDTAAHYYGPESKQVEEALRRVDKMMERLLSGLQTSGIINCINIIIVSDHGFSPIKCDQVLDIRRYTNTSDIKFFLGSFGRLRPIHNSISVDNLVSNLECQNSHMMAYRKEELPVRMHYVDNPRIEPVILNIDPGWTVTDQDVRPDDYHCSGGTHGYDNIFPDMRAIFFGHGPAFKKNVTVAPFLNIELYEMMCEILGINPNPNNGTRGSLHDILRHPSSLSPQISRPIPPFAFLPPDEQGIQSRLGASDCPCAQVLHPDYNEQMLNMSVNVHLPFGAPRSLANNGAVLLFNSDYVVAYHSEFNMPLWVAFTVNSVYENISDSVICWSADARVEHAKCLPESAEYFHRPLYPPVFSSSSTKSEAFYVTNSIPKSVNHTNFLEQALNVMISEISHEVGAVNVIIGTAFDPPHSINIRQNVDSTRNESTVRLPTHIFVILTWCSVPVTHLNECNTRLLEVKSFILPNSPYPRNCEPAVNVIKRNVARVVDIEMLAKLSFYSDLPQRDAIRLQTYMPIVSLDPSQ